MGYFEEFIGVNFWTALFVLLNTLAIFFVAKKFLFGPVYRMITSRQAEIDGMYEDATRAKTEAEQMEKDLRDLSAGQKKKVLLAASICEPRHIHIWDEPMNYIDVISRMQIEELLLTYKPTILFVEHDRAFCDNVATKIVEL